MDDGVIAVMEHSQSLGLAVLLRSGSYCVSRKKCLRTMGDGRRACRE
jgi:hypothetical protein